MKTAKEVYSQFESNQTFLSLYKEFMRGAPNLSPIQKEEYSDKLDSIDLKLRDLVFELNQEEYAKLKQMLIN